MSTAQHSALLAAALLAAGCQPPAPPPPAPLVVRTALAQPASSSLRPRNEYIGLARGEVETDLSFKVGGILDTIGRADSRQDWQEGVPLVAGEILAQLKQEDFLSRVQSARARSELDQLSLERSRKLREQGAISLQELDVVAANRQASAADLAQAEQALADSILRAPYDGFILARLANAGETILPGRPVLRVADLRRMSVEVGVPDKLLDQVHVGREVPLEFPALEGRAFTGTVSEVGVSAKEGARLFRVLIKVSNPDGLLKSGMTARVHFPSETVLPPGAVLIPISALVAPARAAHPHQLAVFVVDPSHRARERFVTTGDFVRSSILVRDGIQAGERVVVVGASTLYEGAPVLARPVEPWADSHDGP